ncbi:MULTISPECIES: glycerate kinase [unclassified Halomonas]|uniref:glycerate kinase n=1 Tax=unclassified Halomonas TaxID=2609666 RepID=UPI001EF51A52|nr:MULTISPECIES: glycerate kinase [unclassified Halomonas]MCG7577840.1 glycerate kinase [Halomonas sp. MMH1-48]MCG7604906.1 glycerate kinase [Halomonas sp. MM17-34]MCG7614128.1 glycerate kinase [Halomonas sp. MM17-29]MCG7621025.1 glycerate kinase [Halomonas sp. DSH1-27]
MNVLLCPDSFKDALSADEAAKAMAKGIKRAVPSAITQLCPLADGGEGSLDALIATTRAERRTLTVKDALGRPRQAAWGWLDEQRTAFIELAEASGLQHLTREERNALNTTTYGVGELFLAALEAGATHALLLLGGSATNDAGAGMLQALGATLLDAQGQPLPRGGAALQQLATLDLSTLDPRLADLHVEAAVDVDNPLLGERGASAVFGPQKGATEGDVAILDRALGHFADLTAKALGRDDREFPGAGAAGGMGFAAHCFLNATLTPGIEMIMQQANVDRLLNDADVVITGEGRLDGQSLAGKTPIGVARAAKRQGKPVIVLAGSLGDGWQACTDEGVTAAFALADGLMTLEQALPRTAELLADRCESIARLWLACR